MQKNYKLPLLVIGIAILLTQITTHTLQVYFNASYITLNSVLDLMFLLPVAFFFILQFKQFEKVTAIMLAIYGAFNILYALTLSSTLPDGWLNIELEVILVLSLMLAHVLFVLGVLFTLLHTLQPKFSLKFTRGFVVGLLAFSFVFAVAGLFAVTEPVMIQIVKSISVAFALAALYASLPFLISEKTDPEISPLQEDKRLKELHGLLERGLITEAEYEARKEKTSQKSTS